jgi:hypothetical protein
MCSMLMGYLYTKFQCPVLLVHYVSPSKQQIKDGFKATLLLYTLHKYYFNVIKYFSKVYYHKSFHGPKLSVAVSLLPHIFICLCNYKLYEIKCMRAWWLPMI